MKTKQYFKGVEELEDNPHLDKLKKQEFPTELPVMDFLEDNLKVEDTSRRDFLKTLGFSVSAAALVASCEIPVKKALPYVDKPASITPGKASYYASSYFDGKDFASVLVKTRDGRPIKIDGNPESPITKGGSTPAMQASVLSLYDQTRYRSASKKGEDIEYAVADEEIIAALNSGRPTVLLTGRIISPSIQRAIDKFVSTHNATHVVYDSSVPSALLTANEQSFGVAAMPVYKFENADVIASFGADFLNSFGNTIPQMQGYISKRKVSEDHATMSKHYQVESYLSQTGSNADVRLPLKPSEMKQALFALYNALGGSISGLSKTDFGNGEIQRMAKALRAAAGKSLVLCGINDVECQLITNAINASLGNIGSTVDFNRAKPQTGSGLESLLSSLQSGIGQLITFGVNPIFDLPNGSDLADMMLKIPTRISLDGFPNETSNLADYILPNHHYLESWGDAEPMANSFSIQQPTINPIFKTRSVIETLLSLSGDTQSAYDYIKDEWMSRLGSLDAWDDVVRNGFYHIEGSSPVSLSSNASSAVSSLSYSAPASSGMEFVLFEDKMAGGRHAGNPLIQELPDPVSKVCWGNYAAVSKKTAEENGWYFKPGGISPNKALTRNEHPGKKRFHKIAVTANGNTVELPVLVQPGMPDNVIGIPVGYGRTVSGLAGVGIGVNAFPLASNSNGHLSYSGNASVKSVGWSEKNEIAQTQLHYTIDDDRPVVQEATLADYKTDSKAGNYVRFLPDFKHAVEPTLYPEREFLGHKWFMSIDLNSCTGCGACVVACNVENNVPVVGKEEIAVGRDMHWLRIDRYYASTNEEDAKDLSNPSVVFMPMMCQHCDNAPCENVCPVNATNHSSEGLNQMAYNRCIGTRYCANNCPFKVRRFNWFDYWGADAWGPGNDLNANHPDTINYKMRDDLTRMVLNPDVTVRSRGVMEKCSFCAQRIQSAKLDAKLDGSALGGDDVKTACQVSCPTHAIEFGDINNKDSKVHALEADSRNYYVLEEIHVLPSVGYLTKISNSDAAPFDKHPEGHFANADRSEAHGDHGDHGDGHGGGHGAGSDSHSEGGHGSEKKKDAH